MFDILYTHTHIYIYIYIYGLSLNGWHALICIANNRHGVTITTHAIKRHFLIWMTTVRQPTKRQCSCVLTLKFTFICVYWWTRQRIHNTLIVIDRRSLVWNSFIPHSSQASGSTLAQVPEPITWSNVDLSSVRPSDILLRAILQQVSQPSITVIVLKSTHLNFHWNLPGHYELTLPPPSMSNRVNHSSITHPSEKEFWSRFLNLADSSYQWGIDSILLHGGDMRPNLCALAAWWIPIMRE